MSATTAIAPLYLDLISPYAYFYWRQRHRLHPTITPKPVLVLFGAILKAWQHKGPAELSTKRVHTYAHCVWIAHQQGLPFKMPPRHPFNPLKALRLLVAINAAEAQLDQAFDWIWALGNDPETDFAGFATLLGVANADDVVNQPTVKAQLLAQTNSAIERGVWGVPTLDFNDHLFWGYDTIEWASAVARNPQLMATEAYQRAALCAPGVQRLF
jgi:2-hydroxychromene-2-carboxylate isomerase